MTEDRGWGVRALVDIPRGSFIAKYIGEILSDKTALKKREDDSYHAYLRCAALRAKMICNPKVKPSVVDGLDDDGHFKTNIAAFFNHSCEPNMFAQMVFTESRVDKLPELSLFAAKDIEAGE
ncbi:SET domain containing protein, partial [Aphelenchoides avenae]